MSSDRLTVGLRALLIVLTLVIPLHYCSCNLNGLLLLQNTVRAKVKDSALNLTESFRHQDKAEVRNICDLVCIAGHSILLRMLIVHLLGTKRHIPPSSLQGLLACYQRLEIDTQVPG